MYTFVYKTFIKFILFCRGQALEPCLSHHSFIILLITHRLIPHFYDHRSSRGLHGRTRVSMPSRAWVVTMSSWIRWLTSYVSMPSRAYTSFLRKVSSGYPQCISECVNALSGLSCYLAGKLIKAREVCFNALTGLSCYWMDGKNSEGKNVSMPSRAWVVTEVPGICENPEWCFNALTGLSCYMQANIGSGVTNVSMPSRAWVVTAQQEKSRKAIGCFNALTGLSCYTYHLSIIQSNFYVSMPSRAWVVTICCIRRRSKRYVSMPSRAWVVTARMSNILNFLWYFLCIPAIYKCILAYLSIFFNQLSEFLRCESPSTFLGTCLSHHSFIILLITSTSALLTGLYLISTALNRCIFDTKQILCQCPLGLIPHFYA